MSKGGSAGFDRAYNSRMAGVAENTFGLSETAFDSWNTGGGRELEEAEAAAGMTLLPGQIAFDQAQLNAGTRLAPLQANLEEAKINSGMKLLPQQTAFESSQLNFGTKSMDHKTGIMGKFYDTLGNNDEDQAVAQAGADVAGAISDSKGVAMRDANRRGVNYKPGGMGLNAAKLKVSAMTNAKNQTRANNLNELATGMSI